MITVALIGPDGVGKTTIAKRLETSFPIPIKYLYMGVNPDASNYMLPTTRWWEKRKARSKTTITNGASQTSTVHPVAPKVAPAVFRLRLRAACPPRIRKSLLVCAKSLGLLNRVAEEWYRQLVAFSYTRRGSIVVFDRHFVYDYFHYDKQASSGTPSLTRRIHVFLLRHLFPQPDLVVVLDAPGSVVFDRKGEFSPELLELRRNQYLSLSAVLKHFAVVDATRNVETVLHDVTAVLLRFYQQRQNGLPRA